MTKHVFILRREVYSGFFVVKFPMFQTLVMGQSNGSFRGFLTQSPGKESSLENT
jgi:hypothetical protein